MARRTLERSGRDGVRLVVALADGALFLGQSERASRLLDECEGLVLGGRLDPLARFEGAVALMGAMPHWELGERARRCERIFTSLEEFRDAFTVNRFYDTHRILLLERVIDALTDELTARGDRVQAWLDGHEQAVRRRLLADWSALCGRTTS